VPKVVAAAADTDLVSSVTAKHERHRSMVLPDPTLAIVCGLVGLGAVVRLALAAPSAGDYSVAAAVDGDNAAPAINALIHGHLSLLASHQPLMGLGSIILRAPFAGLAAVLGAGHQLTYAVGAVACLIPAVLLVTWMIVRPQTTRRQRVAGTVAAAIVLIGPASAQAVHIGHPEEVLAAALSTAAVLAALRSRTTLTWILLGLAVGTKPWAILAVPAVLLALPKRRLATAVRAGALALLLSSILPLADPTAFAHASASVGGLTFADPFSAWWPLGSPSSGAGHTAFSPTGHRLPLGISRSSAAGFGLVIILASLWLYASRRDERKSSAGALALLAVCGLARCVTDPDPLQYNYVAVLIPLAAWEVVALGRLPVATVLAAGAAALLARGGVALMAGGDMQLTPGVINALMLAWTAALGLYLSRQFVHAGRAGHITRGAFRAALAQPGV
jgi:hypothetical protein